MTAFMSFAREQEQGDSRELLPIAALWAGTGGGKSHLLNILADRCERDKIPAILINFNGGHDLDLAENEDATYALVTRFLFGAFNFDCNWDSFLRAFRRLELHQRFKGAEINLVIEAFRKTCHHGGNIFVGVDELIKVPDLHRALFYNEMTAAVHSQKGKMKLGISTLDCSPFSKEILGFSSESVRRNTPPNQTLSNRAILWLKLPPISSQNVLSAWNGQEWFAKRRDTAKWILGLCGGHPRAIAFLGKLLRESPDSQTSGDLYEALLSRIKSYAIDTPSNDVVLDSIALTLTSSKVVVSSESRIRNRTVPDLVACSWFLGDATPEPIAIRLSPLLLYKWVLSQRPQNPIASAVHELLLPTEQIDCAVLERYFLQVERLREWAFFRTQAEKQAVTLAEWYPGAILVNGRLQGPISFGSDEVNNSF